jgi:hypothetical protein
MKDMDMTTECLIVQLAELCGFAEQDDEANARGDFDVFASMIQGAVLFAECEGYDVDDIRETLEEYVSEREVDAIMKSESWFDDEQHVVIEARKVLEGLL